MKQRQLQFVEHGKLAAADGFEALSAFRKRAEFCDDELLLFKRFWIWNLEFTQLFRIDAENHR